jgi:16S rRNA (guanine966-N2)-methyltransferase
MLRIIAGKHRGRKIDIKESKGIRPTGSKARGAIFNILMHGLKGPQGESALVEQPVLDIFCGTGALGLEALSRGASSVTFVDQSQESINLARQNALRMGEESTTHFIRSDSTSLPPARRPVALVFMDPPYNSGLVEKALLSLHRQGWLMQEGVVITEVSVKEKLNVPEYYDLFDEREYGNTKLLFLRYIASPAATQEG